MTALTTPPGSPGARIVGVGAHLPSRVVPNDELIARIDSTDEWIRQRSGIQTRRFAADDESVVDMAVEAAAKAVADAGVDPGDVDLLVLATSTYPLQMPGAAAEIASRVGTTKAGAVDLNAACAGFSYALACANDAVRGGSADLAVVVASERFTNILDLDDRGTSFLFGDGAGAVVVAPADEPAIGPVVWGSDGSKRDLIAQYPDSEPDRSAQGLAYVRMQGPAVYKWAVKDLVAVAREACERAGVAVAELGAFIPHQANLRIIDSLARSLGLPDSVVVARDIVEVGNTSAASIPLAMARLAGTRAVPSGAPTLLFGFGAGLTYAAQVVLMP